MSLAPRGTICQRRMILCALVCLLAGARNLFQFPQFTCELVNVFTPVAKVPKLL